MDWIDNLFSFGSSTDLNGSTAPNSSALPLSTPVDTSGGNGNTSGSFLGSLLGSLSGIGTSAANAYAVVKGTQPAKTSSSTTTTAASSFSKYLPEIAIGAVVLVIGVLLLRKR